MRGAQEHQRGDNKSQTHGAGVDATFDVALNPAVRHGAAHYHAQERRCRYGDGRQWSCFRHLYAETVGKQCGEPVFSGPTRQTEHSEVEQNHAESHAAKQHRECFPNAFLGGGIGFADGSCRLTAFFVQEHYENQRIHHAYQAEAEEGCVPRERSSHRSAKSAYCLSHIESGHVYAHCQRARFALMIIGYQRQSGRHIQRLAHAHQGAKHHHLIIGGGKSHKQCHTRPHEEAAHYEPFAIQAVAYDARDGAHYGIYPQKYAHQHAECLGALQFHYVDAHGALHGRQHLAVHIVEKCHHPQQGYHYPRIEFLVFYTHALMVVLELIKVDDK